MPKKEEEKDSLGPFLAMIREDDVASSLGVSRRKLAHSVALSVRTMEHGQTNPSGRVRKRKDNSPR